MKSDKIRPNHLDRKAILYVRQSTAHQVLHNRESSSLQYAMRDRLVELGWSQIETIDDDLGRSAAGGATRAGFDRMVAEVCLGKVGAVAAREVSRFARNSRDWQQLIEMCRVVDTVLVDQETVYAPRRGNDRLLLGLKGSLNEYVLVAAAFARRPLREGPPRRTRRQGVARYQGKVSRIYFRADAAFAMPEVYEFLEAERIKYAIRLPANQVLQSRIGYLLTRPVGRPPHHVRRFHANFSYQA